MGGVVSSGKDNDDLIDKLKNADYIKTPEVEQVFRIVDRAHYYLPECRESAYKDLAWKNGTLHLSAPCIYSEVMEALELKKGLSFLNLGSGTGYLNTLIGFMIGPYGINHGIELHAENVDYANKKLESFILAGYKFDDLELCSPQFIVGNCLNLAPENRLYDRVYCGASCPSEKKEVLQNMLKIDGILVVPVGDQLLKIKRTGMTDFSCENVLPVSFASLILPKPDDINIKMLLMPDVNPLSLQGICRLTIRETIRKTFDFQLQTPETSCISKVKTIKTSNFDHTFPTAHGVMLFTAMGNSDSSDGDEDDRNESNKEPNISRLININQQFLRHSPQSNTRDRSAHNADNDVDSDLSDMDDEGVQISHQKAATYNNNFSSLTSSISHEENQDVSMENREEKDNGRQAIKKGSAFHRMERNGNWDRFHLRKLPAEESNIHGNSSDVLGKNAYEKIADRIVSIMSPRKRCLSEKDSVSSIDEANVSESVEDGVETSELNTRSPAIQVTSSSGVSEPHTIKESYSVSADTSETSGFGSLGDDAFHISSQHSRIGSLRDDIDPFAAEDYLPMSSSPLSKYKRSPISKYYTGESSVEYDSLTADSTDTVSIDTEEDNDDGHFEIRKLNKSKIGEYALCDKKGKNSGDDLSSVRRPPRGPDFSAYLKAKVEALPIPNSVKGYLLYYRHTGEAESNQS